MMCQSLAIILTFKQTHETITNAECAVVRQVTLRHRQDNGTERGSDGSTPTPDGFLGEDHIPI